MSHFVAYILQFQEIIVYKIPPGGGGGSIASLRSIGIILLYSFTGTISDIHFYVNIFIQFIYHVYKGMYDINGDNSYFEPDPYQKHRD